LKIGREEFIGILEGIDERLFLIDPTFETMG
jgi:hypothetical protein